MVLRYVCRQSADTIARVALAAVDGLEHREQEQAAQFLERQNGVDRAQDGFAHVVGCGSDACGGSRVAHRSAQCHSAQCHRRAVSEQFLAEHSARGMLHSDGDGNGLRLSAGYHLQPFRLL